MAADLAAGLRSARAKWEQATNELVLAAHAWGSHLERVTAGAGWRADVGADALRLRARCLEAMAAYHRATLEKREAEQRAARAHECACGNPAACTGVRR